MLTNNARMPDQYIYTGIRALIVRISPKLDLPLTKSARMPVHICHSSTFHQCFLTEDCPAFLGSQGPGLVPGPRRMVNVDSIPAVVDYSDLVGLRHNRQSRNKQTVSIGLPTSSGCSSNPMGSGSSCSQFLESCSFNNSAE